jgi:hypothetical protein
MRKFLFGAFVAAGSAWSFFTGDWVTPGLFAIVASLAVLAS